MSEDKNCRYRFTVPTADATVNEWLSEQSNISFSLRVLIKAFIRDYGMQDATCLEVGSTVKRRGRPPKQAQIHLESMALDQELSFGGQTDDTNDMYEEETNEKVGASNKSVVTPSQQVEPSANEQSVDDMFGTNASKVVPQKPAPQKQKAVVQETDDEGFVDPESLFG